MSRDRNDGDSRKQSLYDRVVSAKLRWLQRVMTDPALSSTQKCLAWVVTDRLNCVTLDAWPGQPLIAQVLGSSIKTVQRAARGLHNYMRVTHGVRGSSRYAPIFLPEDEDKSVASLRQKCPAGPDRNVHESYLRIPFIESYPKAAAERTIGNGSSSGASAYDRRQRGSYETEVARLLGKDGFEILERLAELDDAIVERLCRAYAKQELGQQEIAAARLAAEQLPKKWRKT